MRYGLITLMVVFGCGCSADQSNKGDNGIRDPDPLPVYPGYDTTYTTPSAPQPAPVVDMTPPGPPAPALADVMYTPSRDSVILHLPIVDGVVDYRAFSLAGASVETVGDERENVLGTVVHCAGYEQRNAPLGDGLRVVRAIEVTGLSGPTEVVIEALDRPCPFPGVLGQAHRDIAVDNPEVPPAVYSIYTEAEVRERFGSLIVNGHGAGATLGQWAEPDPPRVLARTVVTVTPRGSDIVTPTAFFEDFTWEGSPVLIGSFDVEDRAVYPLHFRTSRWNYYNFGSEHAELFTRRGQLHSNLGDWGQDVFASSYLLPRQTFALDDELYLHVTFEVASNSTSRRYWWFFLCGAEVVGQTLDDDGALRVPIVQTPFFHANDGRNPSLAGWNCLQVFPRDGTPFDLPPDNTWPESDVRVMVNRPDAGERDSVVNVSPDQYGDTAIVKPSWYRQRASDGSLVAPMLDDQLRQAPRTRFDLFVRRDRVVMYVNGAQRLCNDFGDEALTMAEAALGIGHVLYHSSAERNEFYASYWDRRGQQYYLHNTPYLDVRTFDNVGATQHVSAPASFDAGVCYTHAPNATATVGLPKERQ